MQLKVTIQQMRSYIRSLDERLADTVKYSDAWCDAKIGTAYEITATKRQPYLNQEVLDLNPYIEDGTEKFQVDMDKDVQGYKRIFLSLNGAEVVVAQTGIRWTPEEDQSIHIDLVPSSFDTTSENTLTFEYYFFPTAPQSETFISADIYHMLRHGMEVAVYESLRDFEKMREGQQKLDESARTAVNGLDIDIKAHEEWNGGFYV